MAIYDLFSKRDKPLPDVYVYNKVPRKLRIQLLHLLTTSFNDDLPLSMLKNNVREALLAEHGRLFLEKASSTEEGDYDAFLINADENLYSDILLDLIELSFRCTGLPFYSQRTRHSQEEIIDTLNRRFLENGVGYEFQIQSGTLIRLDNTVAHQEIVRPALALLAQPDFANANTEYLEAHAHYRKSEYEDVLTKCCSAFESVMKIICHNKGWAYNQNDTASTLLKTIIAQSGLNAFFEQPLILIATLRNKISRSHGQGTQTKNADDFIARYALHATASAILLLVDATK